MCRKELCDTHHLDAVILHVSDEIQIALQVVIAGNKILGPARNRDLQEHIVIRITAQLHCADDRHDGRARGDEAKVLNDVFLANPVLPPYAGTPKDVTDLFEDGQRDHDVERTIEPPCTRRAGVPCALRKAETQTFVSSRTTGFTALGFHFRTRRRDVCLDIRRRMPSGPPMDTTEERLEVLAPFLFRIDREEANLPLAHPHSVKWLQDSVLVDGPDDTLHGHFGSTFRSRHQGRPLPAGWPAVCG